MSKGGQILTGARSPLPTVGFVLACLCLDPRGRATADGVRAGLILGTRIDESSTRDAASEGWNGSWTPFAKWSRTSASTEFDLEARRRFDSTPESWSPRPAVDVARLGMSSRGGGPSTWEIAGRYQRSRDPVSIEPRTVVFPGTTETGDVTAALGLRRAEAGWEMRSTSRQASGAVDGWSQRAVVTLLPLSTPTTGWLIRGGIQNWTLDQREALRVARATTGYRRVHAPGFTTEAEIGVAEVRDLTGGTTDSQPAWGVAVAGFAGLLGLALDSKLRVAHDVTTTGGLDLGRSVSGMSLTLHAERTLEAEGGVFDAPALKDFAAVGIADTVAGDWMGGLEASYARTRLRAGDGPSVETSRASVTAGHRIHDWLTAQTSLVFLRQVETHAQQVDRSHRGRVEIALMATFQ